jgi:hypothetical protein
LSFILDVEHCGIIVLYGWKHFLKGIELRKFHENDTCFSLEREKKSYENSGRGADVKNQ